MNPASRTLLLILCALVPTAAQFQSPPMVGIMLDHRHHLRLIHGMAGNFIVGEPGPDEVLNAVFSGRSGAAKTATHLLLLDETGAIVQSFPAPRGAVRFSFQMDGSPIRCYFESTGELMCIGADGLTPAEAKFVRLPVSKTSVAVPGKVLALMQMGDGWIQVVTAEANYALRLETATLYRLPE